MTETPNQPPPPADGAIEEATRRSGFTMISEVLTCSLLRTLAASKRAGRFLELGTGTGRATAWILDGMDEGATLVSVDHDETFLNIAREQLGGDPRLTLHCTDAGAWLAQNRDQQFDYIFADTWHGKYLMLDPVLAMLKPGGLYIIDDMLPQPNWPDGHAGKVDQLIGVLEQRTDLLLTKQAWASGILIAVKK